MRQVSLAGQSIRGGPRALGDLAFEGVLAFATLTLWPILGDRRAGSAEQRARAMLFVPLIGLIFGIALALIDHALSGIAAPLSRSAIVMAIALIATGGMFPVAIAHAIGELRAGSRPSWTGLTEVGPAGTLVAIGFVAIEIYLLASIHHPPSRARALVLAMMLSRWSMVPIGYGLAALDRSGLGVPYEGGIRFREFAGSSVIAFAITMGLYQVIAIAAIAVVAVAILVLRLLFSRRMGGVAGFALAAGAAVTELVVLALLVAIRL